ncbi:hypothetical protein [Nostoc sp. MG11]|nr:hypothetical protein [Nostoc sp. MG11]
MEQLKLRQESGGSRLYLMDKPIHAGDCVYLRRVKRLCSLCLIL